MFKPSVLDPVLAEAKNIYGDVVTRKQLHVVYQTFVDSGDELPSTAWVDAFMRKNLSTGIRGRYFTSTDKILKTTVSTPDVTNKESTASELEMKQYTVKRDPLFVNPGRWASTLQRVLANRTFFPIYVMGETGTGKTYSIEQVAASQKREVIRVNVTFETGEHALIGGFRLIDGNTVWSDGPVITAMKRGSVLLIDEIDLASSKIMCLQSILEGSGYFIKETGEFVTPAPGFTIIATANTKGGGDASGRYIFTSPLNEAFLERFPILLEVGYMSKKIEDKLLTKVATSLGLNVDNLDGIVTHLIEWANAIRSSFSDGQISDTISTRRLVHSMKMFAICGNLSTAVKFTTNRFPKDVQTAMLKELQYRIKTYDEKERSESNPTTLKEALESK